MKPEPVYGRDDIRYCHYCLHWDGNVYTLDAYGRKRLVHEGAAARLERITAHMLRTRHRFRL